jgi:predicted nucleotidyltransferase
MSLPKQYKAVKTKNPLINKLQASLIVALLSHWLFQSLFYMDKTERNFKLSIDILLTLILMLGFGLSWRGFLISLLIAHTINFLFNGHLYGVLKSFGISLANQKKLKHYLSAFGDRVSAEPSIGFAAVYGSLSREELTATSDLDIRLLRKQGWSAVFCSCWFVCLERTRSLLMGIPLDIYVFDTAHRLGKMRSDEMANVLKSTATR